MDGGRAIVAGQNLTSAIVFDPASKAREEGRAGRVRRLAPGLDVLVEPAGGRFGGGRRHRQEKLERDNALAQALVAAEEQAAAHKRQLEADDEGELALALMPDYGRIEQEQLEEDYICARPGVGGCAGAAAGG